MLKKIRDNLEGLHEEVAKLYEQKADGKFHLKLEDDDAEPLRRAKEHEVGLRQIAERDLAAARAEVTTLQGRVSELERSQSSTTQELRADHERTVAQLNTEHANKISAMEATIKKIYVSDVASRIASEIAIDAGAAELLSESIARRLQVEMVNSSPVTRVLNADGTASNKSPDDLKNEYLQMTKYAGILRASEASGGGASGGGSGGGAAKKLSDYTEAERNALAKENPAELQRLINEAKAAQQ